MLQNFSIKRYRRQEASTYLKSKHGLDYAHTTLAKLAVIGGGPKFQLAGRIPLYPECELDIWAEAKFSPLVSSTSEVLKLR